MRFKRSSNFSGSETSVNVNPNGCFSVTLTAQWKQNIAGIHTIKEMQQMTTAVCNASTTPLSSATALDTNGSHHGDANYVPSTTLTDTRNNATYTVRKLADGNCWMTTDLKLSLTAGQAIEAQSGTFNPQYSTQTSAGTTWTRTGTEGARSIVNNGVYYYNWYAATAGSGRADASSGEVSNSICPRNWRLPSGSTGDKSFYNLLFTKYGMGSNSVSSTKMRAAPFDFSFVGDYYWGHGRMYGIGSDGYWWSSTANSSTYAYHLGFDSSNVYPRHYTNKGGGFTVRCVSQ